MAITVDLPRSNALGAQAPYLLLDDGSQFAISSSVPEPHVGLLALGGAIALGWLGRRRRLFERTPVCCAQPNPDTGPGCTARLVALPLSPRGRGAGVSKLTIYSHTPSKEVLFEALVRERTDRAMYGAAGAHH